MSARPPLPVISPRPSACRGLEPAGEAMAQIALRGDYTGITAHLRLPNKGGVGDFATQAADSPEVRKQRKAFAYSHYFNFYLGVDNALEGGVSFTKKFHVGKYEDAQWREFLNKPGANAGSEGRKAVHAGFGKDIKLALIINRMNVATLYINGAPVESRPGIRPGHVKMVMAVLDPAPSRNTSAGEHRVWYWGTKYHGVSLQTGYADWVPAKPSDFAAIKKCPPKTRSAVMQDLGTPFLGTMIARPR